MSEDQTMAEALAFVEAMDGPAPDEGKPAAQKAAPAVETEEFDDAPELGADAEADALEPEDDDDQDPEGVSAVDAPEWWDAEAKAHFADLTPEAQAVVRDQESKREAVVQKVKAQAAEVAALAKQDVHTAKALAERLAAALPDQRQQFDAYYGDIDWQAYADQDPGAAQKDWFAYQEGLRYFDTAETAKAEAEALARQNFMREQGQRLHEIAPELAGSPETIKALVEYLPKTGLPAEAIMQASAEELVILNESRLYRAMMAKAAAKTTTPPQKSTVPARVPPQGAARTAQPAKQREAQALHNRLSQTRDKDTAAKLIDTLGY